MPCIYPYKNLICILSLFMYLAGELFTFFNLLVYFRVYINVI